MHADLNILQKIEQMTIRLLTRREYSRLELQQKLLAKRFSLPEIEIVLDKLAQMDYQSDGRFASMYLRTRISAGDGPYKIKLKLQEKGVSATLIDDLLHHSDIDWSQQAIQLKIKRFGAQPAQNFKDKAKQVRYLQNKGYSQDHISIAMSQSMLK